MIGFSREEIDQKMDSILAFADIGDFIYQPVKTYSSGMFVRLAFAVAINIDPEILIVDEALSVGDVFFQAKCYKKFEDFKKQGKTILFVSHDLGSISKYCDKVVLLDKGRKIAEGIPRDMVDLYKKALVGHLDVKEAGREKNAETTRQSNEKVLEDNAGEWSKKLLENPNKLEYGDKRIEIVDYVILDDKNNISNSIEKGSVFSIRFRVRMKELIEDPIFAFTIKDLKGTEITGTNTMFEKISFEATDFMEVDFKQTMNLQGGEYLLSLGCTGYENGEFVVYHRLYDVCNISVIAEKNTVGYYDMFSEVTVTDKTKK